MLVVSDVGREAPVGGLTAYWLDLLGEDVQPSDCVQAFLGEYGIEGEAAAMLTPLLLQDVRYHLSRRGTRAARKVFVSTRADFNPIEARRALIRERFPLGNGEWVAWLDATVEQHRMRIDLLTKQISGIQVSVSVHERCIEIIERAGVTCLGEVPESERPNLEGDQ